MRPTVAVLPWGDVVEDFLDPLGLDLEGLRDEMSGGWLFGIVEGLLAAGVDPVLVVVSRAVRTTERWRHAPTGVPLVALPSPRVHRALRRTLADPYGWTWRESARRRGAQGWLACQPARQLAPYTATPVRALGRELRRMRAAAVLCQEYEYQRFDVSVALGRLLRVPVVATFQGGDATRTAMERLVRRRTVPRARTLVVGAREEAERVQARYALPAGRVARIPNPIDVHRWGVADARAARRDLGLPADALVVAWHGRVELHRKGLDLLLEAWPELAAATGPPRRLLLVGTGKEAAALRWWIEHERLEGVVWLDEYVLDKGRVAACLAAADVYAFPSRHEGFPVAPLEAMASGLPVVATAAQGVAEIAPDGEGSGALVVARDDQRAFTAALAALLDDPERRATLGRRARAHVERAFGVEAVGDQLRTVLLGTGASTLQR